MSIQEFMEEKNDSSKKRSYQPNTQNDMSRISKFQKQIKPAHQGDREVTPRKGRNETPPKFTEQLKKQYNNQRRYEDDEAYGGYQRPLNNAQKKGGWNNGRDYDQSPYGLERDDKPPALGGGFKTGLEEYKDEQKKKGK